MEMVAFVVVVGAPRLLLALPPETLLSVLTFNVPPTIEVEPLYVLAPESTRVPVPPTVRFWAPAIGSAMVVVLLIVNVVAAVSVAVLAVVRF